MYTIQIAFPANPECTEYFVVHIGQYDTRDQADWAISRWRQKHMIYSDTAAVVVEIEEDESNGLSMLAGEVNGQVLDHPGDREGWSE